VFGVFSTLDGIIDLKKQRFIRDCKEFLTTGRVSDSLHTIINNGSIGQLDYIKKDLDNESKKLIDIVVEKIREKSRKETTTYKQKLNILCQGVLENLETHNDRFIIREIEERYRESINPIKALYYDLQEIMFLYDGKPKNKHHKFLMEKFETISAFDDILFAVERDLEDLKECKIRIKEFKEEKNILTTSEYVRKVIDLHNEMQQWKRLFESFPMWVAENKNENTDSGLLSTLKKFFT
jgi:hypothetical protein